MNFFEGALTKEGESFFLQVGEQRLDVDDTEVAAAARLGDNVGRSLVVGVRPEHLEDAALVPESPVGRRLRASVRLRESLGSEVMVHFQVEAAPAVSDDLRELAEGADEGALLDALDHERRAQKDEFRR